MNRHPTSPVVSAVSSVNPGAVLRVVLLQENLQLLSIEGNEQLVLSRNHYGGQVEEAISRSSLAALFFCLV